MPSCYNVPSTAVSSESLRAWVVMRDPLEKDERGAADSVGWVPGAHHRAPKRN